MSRVLRITRATAGAAIAAHKKALERAVVKSEKAAAKAKRLATLADIASEEAYDASKKAHAAHLALSTAATAEIMRYLNAPT